MLLMIGVPPASASSVTVGSKTFTTAGETRTVDIILDEAPHGLSGYSFHIIISDPQIAEITGITKPSWFDGLWTRQITSSADNSLAAVDIDQTTTPANPAGNVKPGDTNIRLATVSIMAKKGGTATITLTDEELDSDQPAINQGIISASIVAGTLLVPTDNGTIPVTPTPSVEKNQKGSIGVTSTPSGAKIFINGADTGQKTPHVFADQAVGSYEVYVNLVGYVTPPPQTKSVKKNTKTTFDFDLTQVSPDMGSITVTSTPVPAEIFINGIDTGKQTPFTFTHQPVGRYEVYVVHDGYETPAILAKAVTKGKQTTFEYALQQVPVPVKVKILPNRLNVKRAGYVFAFITLPASYNAVDVHDSSVICEGASALRLIRNTSAPRFFVAVFRRQNLVKVNHGDQVKVTVTGTLQSNGRKVVFKGSDLLKVI